VDSVAADALGGSGAPSGGAQDRQDITITYDARGLVELDGTIPKISEIEGDSARFDAKDLSAHRSR
jgi:hypothetical protein